MKFTVAYTTALGHVGKLNVIAEDARSAQWTTVEYLNGRGHVVENADIEREGFTDDVPVVNALS